MPGVEARIGLVLDMTARNLERVIYYEDYMVIDAGSTPLKQNQLLSEHEYRAARERRGAARAAGQAGPRTTALAGRTRA